MRSDSFSANQNKNINPLYNLADKNLHLSSGGERDHKVLARRPNPAGCQQAVRVSNFCPKSSGTANLIFTTQKKIAGCFAGGICFSDFYSRTLRCQAGGIEV